MRIAGTMMSAPSVAMTSNSPMAIPRHYHTCYPRHK
jgi:hypothetical protein